MQLKIRLLTGFTLFSILCTACSPGDVSEADRLQVNRKYALKSWPDSEYVTHLDSVLSAEPVKANSDSGRVSLTLYTGNFPTVLPEKKAVRHAETRPQTAQSPKTAPRRQGKSAENFADSFLEALGKFQSDPSNAAVFRTVEAKEGEDILKLLSRSYGKDASKLPRFYTLSALQSVNPGTNLEHLGAKDKVRIPKLNP